MRYVCPISFKKLGKLQPTWSTSRLIKECDREKNVIANRHKCYNMIKRYAEKRQNHYYSSYTMRFFDIYSFFYRRQHFCVIRYHPPRIVLLLFRKQNNACIIVKEKNRFFHTQYIVYYIHIYTQYIKIKRSNFTSMFYEK